MLRILFMEQVGHSAQADAERRGVMQQCREGRLYKTRNAADDENKIESENKSVVSSYSSHQRGAESAHRDGAGIDKKRLFYTQGDIADILNRL